MGYQKVDFEKAVGFGYGVTAGKAPASHRV
jgi:hypothetical protein